MVIKWQKHTLNSAVEDNTLKTDNEFSDSDDDVTLGSTSGNSKSDEAISSRFLLNTKESDFSTSFGPRKTDPSSTINDIALCRFLLHLIELSSSCTLYLLLNVCERLSIWVSCVHLLPMFFSPCFSSVLFLSICLNHPELYQLLVPNRWLTYNFS